MFISKYIRRLIVDARYCVVHSDSSHSGGTGMWKDGEVGIPGYLVIQLKALVSGRCEK